MKTSDIAREAAGLAGAGLIAYGGWLAYAPPGYRMAGLFLMAGAMLSGAVAAPKPLTCQSRAPCPKVKPCALAHIRSPVFGEHCVPGHMGGGDRHDAFSSSRR